MFSIKGSTKSKCLTPKYRVHVKHYTRFPVSLCHALKKPQIISSENRKKKKRTGRARVHWGGVTCHHADIVP